MKSKWALVLAALISAGLLALATGCSHSPRRVDCDGHLEPINPVTPKK
jgi:hypothetical protein